MRSCLLVTISVNGLKTLYIEIKTIALGKKQTMFQRKMEHFEGQ